MKLMIVEDETILREALAYKARRSGLPVEIAAEAGDGRTALNLLAAARPDIVVTDIRMPVMDGLAFIEAAAEAYPETAFLIVSGYDDFAYAQRAMKFGVTEYLLKPVDDGELAASLARLAARVERSRRQTETIRQLARDQEQNGETVREQLLTRFVQQGERPEARPAELDRELARLREAKSGFLAAIIQLEPFELPLGSFRQGDDRLLRFAVRNVIAERLASAERSGLLFRHAMRDRELVYLAGLDREREAALDRALAQAIADVRGILRLNVSAAVGPAVDAPEELHRSYKLAQTALRGKVLHGANRVYRLPQVAKRGESGPAIAEAEERSAAQWLAAGDTEALGAWIEERFRRLADDPAATYGELEWLCVELFVLFRKQLQHVADGTEWLIGDADDLAEWLQGLTRWQDAARQMKRFGENIVGHWPLRKSKREDLMESIKRHIDRHFAEPLTLQSVAELFYIHPNYLSRRFKEKFGDSFVDYIVGCRMEEARRLLLMPDVRVYEVAERVGYEDPGYFTSIFRRTFGETPKQYREKRLRT